MSTRDTGQSAARRSAAARADATTRIRPRWARRWVTATGRLVALAAVVAAIAIGAGSPVANSPSAIADKGNRNTPSVTGALDVPTAVVSGVAAPIDKAQYYVSLTGGWKTMQAALQTINRGLQAQDFDVVKAGCQQLSNAAGLFKSTLPSPDSRVTFRIQSAVDNINNASDACMGLGPTSTQADLDHMMSFIISTDTDLKTVNQILGH